MKGQALSPILLPVCTQGGEECGRADVKLEGRGGHTANGGTPSCMDYTRQLNILVLNQEKSYN